MESVFSCLSQRQTGVLRDEFLFKAAKNSPHFVTRLERSSVLKGHHGCVNSVAWNESGSRLVSGADDCHLNFYDTATGTVWHRVHTSHPSNIFSAKFLPWTGDLRVVSCAGVGVVEHTVLSPDGSYLSHQFLCQTSLTYQVATIPACPNEFLTCEEKGLVRLFDLRTKSSCHCHGCMQDVMYNFPSAVTSMAVNPLTPHYIAVALGNGTVSLLDRRKGGMALAEATPTTIARDSTYFKYRPQSVGVQPRKITSVQFNPIGSELLVSYSEDYVYLFNSGLFGTGTPPTPIVCKPFASCDKYSPLIGRKRSSYVRRKSPLSGNKESDNEGQSSSFERPPPVKRFRLRGDWSDTGPNARPGGSHEPRGRGNLMNRMSQMFARWIDMSLSSEDQEVGGASGEGEGVGREEASGTSSSSSNDSSFNLFESDEERRAGREGEGANEGSEQPSGERAHEQNEESFESDLVEEACSRPVVERPSAQDSTAQSRTLDGPAESSVTLQTFEGPESSVSLPVRTLDGQSSEGEGTSDRGSVLCGSEVTHRADGVALIQDRTHEDSTTPNADSTPEAGSVETRRGGQMSPVDVPAINIIEGETDSDDEESHDLRHKSHDHSPMSHDSNGGRGPGDEFSDCLQPFMVYRGHRNSRTMIKQANFWGDNWILSGSDCGRVFVWDKWSGRIVNMLDADSHVVNCVQPHPHAYVLATSGIDYDIKLWEPTGGVACCLDNLEEVMERNETMLRESRNTVTVPSMFLFRILSYLNRRRRMRGESDEEVGPND